MKVLNRATYRNRTPHQIPLHSLNWFDITWMRIPVSCRTVECTCSDFFSLGSFLAELYFPLSSPAYEMTGSPLQLLYSPASRHSWALPPCQAFSQVFILFGVFQVTISWRNQCVWVKLLPHLVLQCGCPLRDLNLVRLRGLLFARGGNTNPIFH